MVYFSIWLLPFLILAVYGRPPTTTNEESAGPHGKLTIQENEELQRQCGHYPASVQKSINSFPATRKEAPWVVGMAATRSSLATIQQNPPKFVPGPSLTSNICSATLISNRHVLTAWHCLTALDIREMCEPIRENEDDEYDEFTNCTNHQIIKQERNLTLNNFRFVFDEVCSAHITESRCLLGRNTIIRKPIKVVSLKNIPQNFEPGHRDLAIFELDKPVEFRADLYPACLSATHPGDLVTLDLYSFGGDEREKNETLNGSLQLIQLSTVPCISNNSDVDGICSRSDYYLPFKGDSGGSLIENVNDRAYVTGVISGSHALSAILSEYIDTAVAHHLDWICRHTGICVKTNTEQITGLIDTITLE